VRGVGSGCDKKLQGNFRGRGVRVGGWGGEVRGVGGGGVVAVSRGVTINRC